MTCPRLFLLAAVLLCTSFCSAQADKNSPGSRSAVTTLSGILLVSDDSSQWGLITSGKQYSVRGKTNELIQHAHHRVTVAGIVSPGEQSSIDRLDVHSIRSSEMPESQIHGFIEQLRHNHWPEPQNISNPTFWVFNFTPPMLQILQAGPAAQDLLLPYLDDPQIKDQIIILLGGVGDQKSVLPIIHSMADRNQARENEYARKVNLAANLALTNITAGDAIWHHGGGITVDACPDDPKSCWLTWWAQHAKTIAASQTPSRNYSNYPNYGIYQSPGYFRLK